MAMGGNRHARTVKPIGKHSKTSDYRTPKPSTASLIHRHPHPQLDSVFCRPSFCSSELAKEKKRDMSSVTRAALDQRLAMAKRCSHEGVVAGAKAAVVATVAAAIPTLASVKMLPWARSNLNPAAQALIISTVAGAAYFIVADKTVLASARKNSFEGGNINVPKNS